MPTPHTALSDLLAEHFTPSELRLLIGQLHDGSKLLRAVPESPHSAEVFADQVVGALERRGRIDEGLFQAIADARPALNTETARVATSWGLRPPAVPTAPRPAPAARQPAPAAGGIVVHGNLVNNGGQVGTGTQVQYNTYGAAPRPSAAPTPPRATTAPRPAPMADTRARSITGLGWDLFLAHASHDKPHVRPVFERTAATVRTFLDEKLPKGTDWDTAIADALHDSAVIAVFVGEHGEGAYYLREEVRAAIDRARADAQWTRVVPIHLDGWPARGARLPYGLGLKQGFAVTPEFPLSSAADALVDVVRELVPRHRLAQLLGVLFSDNTALDAWLRTLPLVDPFVDPLFALPDPPADHQRACRDAVDLLQARGRVDGGLFDLLPTDRSDLVGATRKLWGC